MKNKYIHKMKFTSRSRRNHLLEILGSIWLFIQAKYPGHVQYLLVDYKYSILTIQKLSKFNIYLIHSLNIKQENNL